jgi:putative endonuclease
MENSPTAKAPWFLYLIECDDRRIYAGITNDLIKRFRTHSKGRGAFFTRVNRPIRFIACREYLNRSVAAKAEAQIKSCDRDFKLAWADANPVPEDIQIATLDLLRQRHRTVKPA